MNGTMKIIQVNINHAKGALDVFSSRLIIENTELAELWFRNGKIMGLS